IVLPKKEFIEEERYSGGQPMAELGEELIVTAAEEGIVELLPIGADGGVLIVRDADTEEELASYLIPAGMEPTVGAGEFVEEGDELARAAAGATLTLPRSASAVLRAAKAKGTSVTATVKVGWERTAAHETSEERRGGTAGRRWAGR